MRSLNDYELIYLIVQGDKEAEQVMLEKYNLLVWKNVNTIFSGYVPTGVERDDLYQEGRISLFKSFTTFDPERNVPFFAFANLCIERSMIGYIRKFSSNANKQFYSSLSLDAFVSEEISLYNNEVLADPEIISSLVKFDEQFGNLYLYNADISKFEKDVLVLQVAGFSYMETALHMKCSVKKIDNTLQKVKRLLS